MLDLDIKGLFDNLDHQLVMRAVRKHTDCKWVLLYIERWLKPRCNGKMAHWRIGIKALHRADYPKL